MASHTKRRHTQINLWIGGASIRRVAETYVRVAVSPPTATSDMAPFSLELPAPRTPDSPAARAAPAVSPFAAKLANHVATNVSRMEDASHETEAFRKKLDELYPGALNYEEAVVRVTHVLNRYGFTADSSIALVSQCRVDVVSRYVHAIDVNWKGWFNLSSFAGTVFAGKTGFGNITTPRLTLTAKSAMSYSAGRTSPSTRRAMSARWCGVAESYLERAPR